MSMKPPKSIRLAGRVFPIVVRTDDDFCGQSDGEYKQSEGKILLSAKCGPDQMKATAIHELMHDLDAQSALNLGEKGVNVLSAFLFAALRDNPAFVNWIMES